MKDKALNAGMVPFLEFENTSKLQDEYGYMTIYEKNNLVQKNQEKYGSDFKRKDVDGIFPINIYTDNVIIKPEKTEKGLLYKLFADVYLTKKKYFLGSNIKRGELAAIARTGRQPILFDPSIELNNDKEFEKEGFCFLLFWKPNINKKVLLTTPKNYNLPFLIKETEIITNQENKPILVPFYFKKNIDILLSVLEKETPIVEMIFLD
jgi:hypothetical protein